MIAATVTYIFAVFPESFRYRGVFLVGILPALIVFWIRKSVPEPTEWVAAKHARAQTAAENPHHPPPKHPPLGDLFKKPHRVFDHRPHAASVCALCGLTAWWAFMFWINKLLRGLPDMQRLSDTEVAHLVSINFFILIGVSIPGNFFASALGEATSRYRRASLHDVPGFSS